jgi:Sec-independent protein secretion pathway component TatC
MCQSVLFIFKNPIVMSIQERIQSPTPPFFAKLRNWSLILVAISGAILTTPVVLPAIVVKVAGYLAVAGTVAGAVSQAVTTDPAS